MMLLPFPASEIHLSYQTGCQKDLPVLVEEVVVAAWMRCVLPDLKTERLESSVQVHELVEKRECCL